jgi:hypothetical protein
MAEPCLDGLNVDTVGDEKASEVVAQVVIAETRRKALAGFHIARSAAKRY